METNPISRKKVCRKNYPLFPSYVFVRLRAGDESWGPINSTLGISHLIKFGSKPVAVPNHLIKTLKARCDVNDALYHFAPVSEGQKVRISSGPFADFVAAVDRIDTEKRILLLIELLGRDVRLNVPSHILHPA